jgi:3-deoxy-manno-octulosonate cytidylyltransferase (CMP-KDO synthetase)
MKFIGIIPARYASTRFPGKPLADLGGKPMIQRVYEQAKQVLDTVIVATDDKRIYNCVNEFGGDVVMTSPNHTCGTDRVYEAYQHYCANTAQHIDHQSTVVINIQGDEPLLEPSTIKAAIEPFYNNPDLQISNLMTKITDPIEVVNFTVPKVITNKDGIGVYLTRATAPYPKGSLDYAYYKQVCVYGFKPEALQFYCDYGIKYGKAKVEAVEDIEILRFIENGYKVQYIEVDSDTVAVDTPNDLEKVRKIVQAKIDAGEISNN